MSEEKSRRRTPYPTEMRERAIRMVLDHWDEYPSQWAAIGSVAEKLSINRETLRLWVRRAETDEGRRPWAHHRRAGKAPHAGFRAGGEGASAGQREHNGRVPPVLPQRH